MLLKARRIPWSALLCALCLPLSVLAAHGWVELGLNDDWSYIKSAQVLAHTGHIAYNGWSTATLGWQLYWGALFAKLFGDSFTAVRLSTLVLASATIFLFHRLLVRCGITEQLSSLGALTLGLCPLFVPLSIGFMSDVSGLFVLFLCLYACTRAVATETPRSAVAWICFAAITNALGGTVRQIAWLGLLVLVPCTLWLVRLRRGVLLPGLAVWALSLPVIPLTMHWFARQPFTLAEPLLPGHITLHVLKTLSTAILLTALDIPPFLLPVLILFLVAMRRSRRNLAVLTVVSTLVAMLILLLHGSHRLDKYMFPTLGNYVSVQGLLQGTAIHGAQADVLTKPVRLLVSVLGITGAAAVLLAVSVLPPARKVSSGLGWHQLVWLLLPLTVAYFGLLLPRAAFQAVFDRYLIVPLAFFLIALLRWVSDHAWNTPAQRQTALALAFGAAGCVALFTTAATHDAVARFRAQRSAIDELRLTGVPATRIDGGFEFNGWTQIETTGFVTDARLPGYKPKPPMRDNGTCGPQLQSLFPSLNPKFTVAFQPDICGTSSGLPPVVYRTWLPPRQHFVYVVSESGG